MIKLYSQLDQLVTTIDTIEIDPVNKQTDFSVHSLSVITIFQFCKKLSDREMINLLTNQEGIRAVTGFSDHTKISPRILCEFRSQISQNEIALTLLDQDIFRLSHACKLPVSIPGSVKSRVVIDTVCLISRVDNVQEAFMQAIEAITVLNPAWMTKIALPHWLFSYPSSANDRPADYTGYQTTVNTLGADIEYLFQEIKKTRNKEIASLKEVQNLRMIWSEQYEYFAIGSLQVGQIHWRSQGCAFCNQIGGGDWQD